MLQLVSFFIVLVIGVAANALLLAILLKYQTGWSVGKKMLMLIHVTELVLLLVALVPLIAVASTTPLINGVYRPDYGNVECAFPAVLTQFVLLKEPLSLALLAHIRWRVVRQASTKLRRYQPPRINRYIACLLLYAAVQVVIGILTQDGRYGWASLAHGCLVRGQQDYFRYLFLLQFVVCAPYIFYCYRKVIGVLRQQEKTHPGNGSSKRLEAIRLLFGLTGYYYVSHTLFFVNFFLVVVLDLNVTSLEFFQATVVIYYTNAMMSPILSILLTQRYRLYALRILHFRSQGSTMSGSASSDNGSGTSTRAASSTRVPGRRYSTASSITVSLPPMPNTAKMQQFRPSIGSEPSTSGTTSRSMVPLTSIHHAQPGPHSHGGSQPSTMSRGKPTSPPPLPPGPPRASISGTSASSYGHNQPHFKSSISRGSFPPYGGHYQPHFKNSVSRGSAPPFRRGQQPTFSGGDDGSGFVMPQSHIQFGSRASIP